MSSLGLRPVSTTSSSPVPLLEHAGHGSRNRWGEYYARCRDRGMPHGKALKAVARKRLKVIYAIMRDKVPYAA